MYRPVRFVKTILIIVLIMLFISACNLPQQSSAETESEPAAVNADTKPADTQNDVQPTEEPPTEMPPTDEPVEILPTEEPSPTPIMHLVVANITPPGKPQVIHDQESDRKADQKEAYAGDEFLRGRYERPFDQNMNYIPVIDIKQANLFRDKDDEFIYAIIHLKEDPALFPDSQFGFGIELDLDIDGRGDVLIWTARPLSKEWSVEGVSIWKDLNKNIGSLSPMRSDPSPGDDGYEIKVFDAGVGADPDLAWSRISSDDPKLVELSFKKDLLDDTKVFLWGAWAIQGEDQFNLFDHHDHYSFEEAGSPMKSETAYYPLKAMYALDNTCRAASGYNPNGGEPGLCPISAPSITEEKPEDEPGCVRVCLRQCLTHVGCCEWGCR